MLNRLFRSLHCSSKLGFWRRTTLAATAGAVQQQAERHQRLGWKQRSLSTSKRIVVTETKWVDQPFNAKCFDLFKLFNFSKTELSRAFETLDLNGNGIVEREELVAYVKKACAKENQEMCISEQQLDKFCDEFMQKFEGKEVTREQFDHVVLRMANTVDPRVWPITVSMVLTGTAIGVIIPVMPLFVKSMGLTSAEYGMVVSSFALSKLLGNIPCAFLSDKHGRKPVMTGGLALVAVGMGGIGFVDTLSGLMLCRLISGLGASAFTTASMLYLMDIGTPFTRTKTMAPISAGFSAGAAIGPALGGLLVGVLGLEPTFSVVGCAFALFTVSNYYTLTETLKPRPLSTEEEKGGLKAELGATFRQWKPLLLEARFRSILGMNVMYWLALSGSYMTLLPLMLVREEFGLTPAQIGGVFAMTSAVNVISTQPAAWLADRYGKPPAIVLSSFIVSGAMFSFPLAPHLTPALGILALWSLGGTIFGMAPTAYVTDIVKAEHRSQALALLRTTGDVGLLLGASVTGLVADHTSQTTAMQMNSAALLGTAMWFGSLTHAARRSNTKK